MRFGWLTLSLSPSPEEDADRIDQQIEQVRFAERLGFGDVWLTEHYFTGESVYNDALLFASAVAMRTERIRIGFAVVQLPFHHPVRLAVQLALLDNLSRGRIDVGVGKGTIYNEYEFVGHGLRSDDSRARMEEAIDIIGRLWGGGPVIYNGKYFQLQVPQLRPRPVQRPHPPLWRSVISPSSFSECGRLGVPILTARPTPDETARAPHLLYGHLAPDETWSAGEWLRAARPHIDAATPQAPLCTPDHASICSALCGGWSRRHKRAVACRPAPRAGFANM